MSSIKESRERPHELKLDLPAAHSAERMARQVLRQFARREGVPPDELTTLEFVAGELLSNAVDHGGGERAMEEADLRRDVRTALVLTVDPDGWELEVSDQGGGDPGALQGMLSARDLPELEDERGRGFYLLSQMVDRLDVVKSKDGLGLAFRAARRYAR